MTSKELNKKAFNNVVVHPLVLLSVVDHFNRLRKTASSQKRVVGVLLGSSSNGELDISNSFAVPFEEDAKDKKVWFLDHDYLDNMFAMFKKVNARERIVGWYHSGPKLHSNDIIINELFRKYTSNSVLVVVDVSLKDADALPTEAYIAVEEINDDGSPTVKTFEHLNSEIGAETSEEVGVEHLLRDIKDSNVGTLMQSVMGKVNGLNGLQSQLESIIKYITLVIEKKIPVNHKIIYLLQDIFNLLPDVKLQEMVRCIHINTNDHSLVIFIASMMRSILALHDLVQNKLTNRDLEKVDGFPERKFDGDSKPSEVDKTRK